ncbi:hypothetical protein J8L88_23170 [Aquimarina sp. MMG015]|uniref:hypothetical protein n=1 Tax=Aquimarina TaxID=290174 RepID=UPI0003FF1851|nr:MULTISPECIES: hypothetical protein [Aquimarina]MBQ4805782.1 hypothetical protein [Aquimarina sp. MMG015]
MKKSILNIGKTLSREELKQINGQSGGYYCPGGNSEPNAPRCPVPCFMGNCFL